jgi:ribosomal protein S18 acetylase RimI-like enzyme
VSVGGLSIARDPWLTAIMLRDVRRVSGAVENGAESEAEQAVSDLTRRPGFSYARVPTHDLGTSRLLERCGFYVVDTGITLETRGLPERRGGEGNVRLARAEDQSAVEAIARHSIVYSRFHLDPEIPRSLAQEIKAQWAGNYFRGQRGDSMVVAEREGEVAGFLQLIHAAGGVLVIDLIAVAEAHRRHGLARQMIGFAVSAEQPHTVRAVTQSTNIGSLALYQGLGFCIVATNYVFHHHGRAE